MREKKADLKSPPLRKRPSSDFLPWTFFQFLNNESTSGPSLRFCHSCPSLLKDIAWEKNRGKAASFNLHLERSLWNADISWSTAGGIVL